MINIQDVLDMVAGDRIIVTLNGGDDREYWQTEDGSLLTVWQAKEHWKHNYLMKCYLSVIELQDMLDRAQRNLDDAFENYKEDGL